MRTTWREKGFTLVEMAIVLVIIGVILGAVLKGQDLIAGARTKKMINDTGRKFEVAAWSYYDKKGRFPGDNNRDGVIAGTGDTWSPFQDYTSAKLSLMPSSPVTLGSAAFYTFYGNDGSKNIIAICKDATCTNTFTDDELDMAKAFDLAIDGNEDGATGSVRGATGATAVTGTAPNYIWKVTAATLSNAAWSTSDKAIIYYFDRRP
jgi:prepilin-type N-terminal cleavage/methylation domain-containing protein